MAENQDKAKLFLDHAVRCWEAEQVNAERIAKRSQLMVAAVVTLLGLGLYKVEWLRSPDDVSRINPFWVICAIKTLLVVAALMFGAAAWAMVYRTEMERRKDSFSRPTASWHMRLHESDAKGELTINVFRRVYRAYVALQEMNGRRWSKLRRAEKLFGTGFFLVLAALVLYIVFSVPPIPRDEVQNGGGNTESRTSESNPIRSDA